MTRLCTRLVIEGDVSIWLFLAGPCELAMSCWARAQRLSLVRLRIDESEKEYLQDYPSQH